MDVKANSLYQEMQAMIAQTRLDVNPQPQVEEDNSRLGNELRHQEHQIILDTLTACKGKRKDVAEKLGISPRTLRYKLARMRDQGIDVPA